jgi:hypothetical protein
MGPCQGPYGCRSQGEVVEWLMAPVLKTGEVKASVGSNPTLSVLSDPSPRLASRLVGDLFLGPASSTATQAMEARKPPVDHDEAGR